MTAREDAALEDVTTGSVQRLLTIAKREGWEQVVQDCRDQMKVRSYQEARES